MFHASISCLTTCTTRRQKGDRAADEDPIPDAPVEREVAPQTTTVASLSDGRTFVPYSPPMLPSNIVLARLHVK